MVDEGVGYEVSWSHYGSCHLCIWFYEVLTVEIKNFVKELLRKITLIIAKAISWIPEPTFLSLSVLISVKSCWVLLYSGFVDPCCRWASWADLFWIVLHDGCSLWWRWEVNVWPLGREVSLCVLYYIIMPLHYFVVIIIELSYEVWNYYFVNYVIVRLPLFLLWCWYLNKCCNTAMTL